MNLQEDVVAFNKKFGHPAPDIPVRGFIVHSLEFRRDLIMEECKELCEAIDERNIAKIAAECVDLIYVVIGTMVFLGLPLMPFWCDIHRANMDKEKASDGGKPIKPKGWVAPNPARVLYELRQQSEQKDIEE